MVSKLFLAALGLHCFVRAFSSCDQQRLLLVAVHRLLLLRSTGAVVVARGLWSMGLVARRHVESSQTRDLTHVACIGRQVLNYWTTKEVPDLAFDLPKPLLEKGGKIKDIQVVKEDLLFQMPSFLGWP